MPEIYNDDGQPGNSCLPDVGLYALERAIEKRTQVSLECRKPGAR